MYGKYIHHTSLYTEIMHEKRAKTFVLFVSKWEGGQDNQPSLLYRLWLESAVK